MVYQNNDRLREYLDRGAAGAYREHLRCPRFEFNEEAFAAALDQVCAQFPALALEDAKDRAAFRLLTGGVAPEVAAPLPSSTSRAETYLREKWTRIWPWLKLGWALLVLVLCAATLALLSALVARAEPTPQNMRAYRNALRGFSLLASSPGALAAPQQPGGLILQFQQGGSPLATRPTGLVAFNCGTGMSCSFSGTTFTLTSTGAGGSGCVPPGTPSRLLYDDGAGNCLDSGLTWSGGTATAPSGVTLTYSGSGSINARNWAGTGITNTESLGKIPIGNGDGTATWADPFVSGITPHDAVATSTNPVLTGGYASATAPTDVSNDGDAVRAWFLRNGSQVFNLASGGTLVTLGQKTMSSSLPVTLASDQGAVPVSASSLPLPAGASTSANQTTANASLSSIDSKAVQERTADYDTGAGAVNTKFVGIALPASGGPVAGGTAANPVRIDPTGTTTQPVSASTLPLPTGAATESTLSTLNSKVTAVDTGNVSISALPNEGQQTMANSISVAVASNQSPVPIAGSGTGSTTGYLNCDNTAVYDAGTNGSTQLVALTSGQTIYVCGFQISTSQTTAVSVNLRYGTGTNCGTGPSNITPSYPLQAATSTGPIGMVVMTPGFTGLKTAASNALCINTNAAVSVQALVWYAKF